MHVSLIISATIGDSYGFNMVASQLKKLKPHNVEVQQFYLWHKFDEYYPQKVLDELISLCKEADLIGISLLSSGYRNAVQITKAIRKNIDCPVIWGGKHPTIDPEDCIKYADMICISEGEDTLYELVKNLNAGVSFDKIEGLWIRKNSQIIKNKLRPLVFNLDRFIFPDYSLDNKFVFDKSEMRIRPLKRNDVSSINFYPTMITRGCPYFCTFCVNSTDKRLRTMRWRGSDNVLAEIKGFLALYPEVKNIFFRDDCLSEMSLEYINDFCEHYKKEIGLPCSLSGILATSKDLEEKVSLLTDAGFTNFKLGIQSGCERVRRKVYARVKETDEVIKEAVSIMHAKNKGKICYYMITDNPYETEEELVQSIRFTSRLPRPFSLSLFSLDFYPGTYLYNKALKDNYIKDKEETLQKSTMEFKNTYLNKVFISLKFFEIPPLIIDLMTSKKIYSNYIYQQIFNAIFSYLFQTDFPTRDVTRPSRRRIKFNPFKFTRWLIWFTMAYTFRFYHRSFIK